jgi:hypothetical protein
MANTKLMKVMEYLINEQEDKARDLLHQIFIEKARAIHEEMMHEDPDSNEALLAEIDAEEGFYEESDDEDDDVADAVEDLSDELEVSDDEESDEDDMDADDMDDEDDDDDMSDDHEDSDMEDDDAEVTSDDDAEYGTPEDVDHKLMDLEAAIEELRKEFESMQDHEDADDSEDADLEVGSKDDLEADVKVDEAWEFRMDEEFDDLAEGIAHELDTIVAPKMGEVGAGKFARAETSTHSPVPASQKDHMGARPVKTGQGKKAQGYDREAAPVSKSLGGENRRKHAEDNKKVISKEGDARAKLNKDRSEGFGAPNTRSPIQGR